MAASKKKRTDTRNQGSSERSEPRALFAAAKADAGYRPTRRRRMYGEAELRRVFSSILEQPLPTDFIELLHRIDQHPSR